MSGSRKNQRAHLYIRFGYVFQVHHIDDMPFTRAHGVARLHFSVASIEFVPDVVKWTYVGVTYELEIEIEDPPLFQESDEQHDMDTTEGVEPLGIRTGGLRTHLGSQPRGPSRGLIRQISVPRGPHHPRH